MISFWITYQSAFNSAVDEAKPVLGEKAAHNNTVVYSMDFQVTPHQLRHTYITNLIHASIDPKTVQYLAGHENSKITMDIYVRDNFSYSNGENAKKPRKLRALSVYKSFQLLDKRISHTFPTH